MAVSRSAEEVNNWFYTPWRDGISPANTAVHLFYEFTAAVKKHKLAIAAHDNRFMDILCEAFCTLYDAEKTYGDVRGPVKRPEYIKDWNDELEYIWSDYLASRVLHEEFWNMFWHKIYAADWEISLPRWRAFLQSALPFYIHRDIGLLVAEGLVFEDEEGNILNSEEALDAAEYEENYP